jgi:tRNA C32,U32 (ribose-2'-O)-methylase TrmJ
MSPTGRPPRWRWPSATRGGGLSSDGRAHATRLVSIPIVPSVESLNAAVAGAILLYALRPRGDARGRGTPHA